jgi:hypothetical protein
MTNEDAPGHELRLGRLLAAPRGHVWRCWTEPGSNGRSAALDVRGAVLAA